MRCFRGAWFVNLCEFKHVRAPFLSLIYPPGPEQLTSGPRSLESSRGGMNFVQTGVCGPSHLPTSSTCNSSSAALFCCRQRHAAAVGVDSPATCSQVLHDHVPTAKLTPLFSLLLPEIRPLSRPANKMPAQQQVLPQKRRRRKRLRRQKHPLMPPPRPSAPLSLMPPIPRPRLRLLHRPRRELRRRFEERR